jgi:MEDS: MEthanogen/methylotroph, DcmR Sensory domain
MSDGRHGVGIPGLHIESQDHVCALYEGAERRDEVLIGFLRAGLEEGDKCVWVVDEDDPSEFLAKLAEPNDVKRWQANGAINVRGAEPEREQGDELTIDEMLATWDEAMAAADQSLFPFVRVTGDATWWSTQAGADNLVRYECALTDRLPDNVAVMCCYDVAEMDGSTLVDAVRTHPTLLVGSVIIENPFYLPTDELEAARQGSAPDEEIEAAIRQLAKLPRLDADRPMIELECGDCGTALFAPESGRPRVELAPWFITCPRCSAIWEQRPDGTLVRWWEGIEADPR